MDMNTQLHHSSTKHNITESTSDSMMFDTHRTLFTTVPLHRHFLTKPPGKRFSLTHTRKYSNWVACGLPDQPDHTNLKSAKICKSKGQLCFCLHLRNKWLQHWRHIKSWQPSSLVLVVWCESSVAFFPGLLIIQFLTTYTMHKQGETAWFILSCESMPIYVDKDGGGVPIRNTLFLPSSIYLCR